MTAVSSAATAARPFLRCRIRPATTAASVSVQATSTSTPATCGGLLVPVSAEPDPRKGFIIGYKCKKCGSAVRCRAANDDDTDLLIRLTVNNG